MLLRIIQKQISGFKYILINLFVLIFSISILNAQQESDSLKKPVAIAIHGGAGTILKKNLTPEMESQYRLALETTLDVGYDILNNGGSSLDAVEAAIKIMEDSPLFNAGKGAVFTNDGTNELDASIMDGRTLEAGAVAGVKHIKNPISLARLVLEKSPHVMLTGTGAEEFAVQHNLERVSQYYFYTERRWKSLKKTKEKQILEFKEDATERLKKQNNDEVKGTVGVVALDKFGNLAAGTSTGGLTNKMFGRIGDSPIIGAGTYANNETCAVSCTGSGEYFIRLAVAHNINALMAYKKLGLNEAANYIIMEKLTKLGGKGGVIAIDKEANVAWPFNTDGMYRAYKNSGGEKVIKIYKEE